MKKQTTISGKEWQECPLLKTQEELFARLLQIRNLENPEGIQAFLHPTLQVLHDPFLLLGMQEAVDRIHRAIEQKERVVVYGDFDADGITATVILVHALRELGAEVSYRIPDRTTDSHGLKNHHIDILADREVKLLITCDCGISDSTEVQHAVERDMDVIVTDHHQVNEAKFPATALAIINPHQKDCPYPDKELSGSGVAFKLVSALGLSFLPEEELPGFLESYLEIAAIGTIADCMKLRGENRVLSKFGLEKLKTTQWSGLALLLQQGGVDFDSINEETVGYFIAPRLNAASRIGDVLVATQLFLGEERDHLSRIMKLETWNTERRRLTESALSESEEQLVPGASIQFLESDDWKPGVLGLIAGRQSDRLGVPIIALTSVDDEVLTASCRAPLGLSIIEGLQQFHEEFIYFGGHDGAAGFRIEKQKWETLKPRLIEYYNSVDGVLHHIQPEASVPLKLLDEGLLDFLGALGPFGEGNPLSIFELKGFKITDWQMMGESGDHMRIFGEVEGQECVVTAFFCSRIKPHIKIGTMMDVLITVHANVWKGERRIDLRWVDGKVN